MLGNLFKVRQLVMLGSRIFNWVSSQSHCMMSLPKMTGKCDTEVMGCPMCHVAECTVEDVLMPNKVKIQRGVTGP